MLPGKPENPAGGKSPTKNPILYAVRPRRATIRVAGTVPPFIVHNCLITMPEPQSISNQDALAADLQSKKRLLASMHKISSLLIRPISLDSILNSIVKETSQVFGFTRAAIFLADPERRLLECRYIHGFNAQDSGRAFRYPYRLSDQDCVETRVFLQGKTIFVRDYASDPQATEIDRIVSRTMNRVSTIAVPLRTKEQIIGLITADKGQQHLRLGRRDIDDFSTFANQASAIIENARLQEQNQSKIKQLLTLQEIMQATSSQLEPDLLHQAIVRGGRELVRAQTCALLLRETEQGPMRMVSSDRQTGQTVDGQDHLAAQVLASGQSLLAFDSGDSAVPAASADTTPNRLAVPLSGSEQQHLGVLVADSMPGAAFTREDLKSMLIFAGHAASLIRNVRLYDQVMTERNFRDNILESSPDCMITIGLDRRISSLNRKAEEMLGLRRDAVLDRRADEVLDPTLARLIDLALEHHVVVADKELTTGSERGRRSWGATSSLLRDHQGALLGAMLVVRDLTEEKKTEALIRRIDRLTSLGQLSAGVAHEIRNPLASISFNVQLLAKKLPESEATSALIGDIREGIDRISTLVKGMLDFAKPSLPNLKRDSIVRVLANTITLLDSQLKSNRISVRMELHEAIPELVFDAHQMQQVFVNLLLNAMEAMPDGGRIQIDGRIDREAIPASVVLTVTDHGPGIPTEQLSEIFNPFFTTKAEGSGLGLSIVHRILEQHGVSVEVQSEPGAGAAFLLRFPLEHDEARP
jgi:two-component system NtrC family sensor kinase